MHEWQIVFWAGVFVGLCLGALLGAVFIIGIGGLRRRP